MTDQPHDQTLIQSVSRALRLLEAVAELDHTGASAKRLARATGLALPTTYHLLRTLEHEGYLHRGEDGAFHLGPRVELLTEHGRAAGVAARVRRILEGLREETHAAVYLAMYDEGEILVADVADGVATPRIDLWVGLHEAAHATALGKSILANLDPPTRADYLARHRLEPLTRRTVISLPRLQEELAGSGRVALDHEEYSNGVMCLACPVRIPGSDLAPPLVGALGVAVLVPTGDTTSRRKAPPTDAASLGSALEVGAARVSRVLALADSG
jgi:IclR family acetate operon transcriptional repressor